MKHVLHIGLAIGLLYPTHYGMGQVKQEWVRFYDGRGKRDEATAMDIDKHGNVYVTGPSRVTTYYDDYATIKYNSAGDSLWERNYDGPTQLGDVPVAIGVDFNEYVYVTGYGHISTLPFTAFVTISYESDSSTKVRERWRREFPSPAVQGTHQAYAMTIDRRDYGGDEFIAGWNVNRECVTLRYDPFGTRLWDDAYAPADNVAGMQHKGTAVALDNSRNVIVAGWSDRSAPAGFRPDNLLIKYGLNGGRTWVERYHSGDTNSSFLGLKVAVDASNQIYVGGNATIGIYQYVFLLKYDSTGQFLWERDYPTVGDVGSKQFTGLAVDFQGNPIISCGGLASSTDNDVVKYAPDGGLLWATNSGGGARAIAVDDSGDVYVTGTDYRTTRFDGSTGDTVWRVRYNGVNGNPDQANAIAVDDSGNEIGRAHV